MRQDRVSFAGVSLCLPPGWYDITDDLEAETPPTLARGADGFGALQFTTARYRSGANPSLGTEDLDSLLDSLVSVEPLTSLCKRSVVVGRMGGITQDFSHGQDFVRIYYLTDGNNVVMVTYRCELSDLASASRELSQADAIVASIRFD